MVNVVGYTLHNILVDTGSLLDILFIKPFEIMRIDRQIVEPAGFDGKKIEAIGKKMVLVSFIEGERVRTKMITFNIVNRDYPYTTIFGRGLTNKFEVTIKQSYLCMKMPSPFDIITMHGDQIAAKRIEAKATPSYSLINKVTKQP